jgi:leader peptidase (prepilin peptidase)/N-methyltransferase
MQFSIPLGILSLIGGIFIFNQPILYLICGGLVGFLFFYIQYAISKGTWVGMGDADLALAIGLLIGPGQIGITIFSAYLLGSILGIYLLLTKKASGTTQIPLGPFLVTGFYINLFYGTNLTNLILGL